MWPFTAYPEVAASEVNGKTYDYVVVGGQQIYHRVDILN